MTKYEKLLVESPQAKTAALEILKTLNGWYLTDAVDILDAVKFFLKDNSKLNFDDAHSQIISLGDGDA